MALHRKPPQPPRHGPGHGAETDPCQRRHQQLISCDVARVGEVELKLAQVKRRQSPRTPRNRAILALLVRLAVTLGTPRGTPIALVTHPRRVVLVLVAALPPIVRQDRDVQLSCCSRLAWAPIVRGSATGFVCYSAYHDVLSLRVVCGLRGRRGVARWPCSVECGLRDSGGVAPSGSVPAQCVL